MEFEHTGFPSATATLGAIAPAVERRLAAMAEGGVIRRIWERDHTVWKPDPTEIANRLDWLTVAERMMGEVPGLRAFRREVIADGMKWVVLLGMGGSSLAPEVMRATLGRAEDGPELIVLDSTDPVQIGQVEARIDPDHTLFIVASKSGGTIETRSHFDYFWEKLPNGLHYAVITDPGSALEQLGRERKVRRTFLNPAGIGGRYSALSLFGLVPAALIGANIEELLARAIEMMRACQQSVPAENSGAWLGAVMAEAALTGRDKVTFAMAPELEAFGYWVEQLIAESTGKEGRGIVPVEGEPLGVPEVYGNDRLFVAIGEAAGLDALAAAGHPVVRIPYRDGYQLGAEFFRWEFATVIAGHILGINPFDQPNVQEAKDATAAILAGKEEDDASMTAAEALATVVPGDYIAITAYLPREAETVRALAAVRVALRDRYGVATTVGFGPRFLHSTGQLHKGGPNTGVFLQLVSTDGADLAIPGQPFSFGELKAAQALGDLASLKAHGRRVWRGTLEELREVTGLA